MLMIEQSAGNNFDNKVIGVITTHLADYIFPEIISGIDRVISDEGYSLFISNTHNTYERERQSLMRMIETGVNGLIIEPTMSALPNANKDLYDQIRELGIPTVFINSTYEHFDFPYLEVDDTNSEADLINHLIAQGHERILGVFKVDDVQGAHRMQGFYKAYQQHPAIALHSNIIMYQSNDEASNAQILNKIENARNPLIDQLPWLCTMMPWPFKRLIWWNHLVCGYQRIIWLFDGRLCDVHYMTPSLTTALSHKVWRCWAGCSRADQGHPVENVRYDSDIIIRDSSNYHVN